MENIITTTSITETIRTAMEQSGATQYQMISSTGRIKAGIDFSKRLMLVLPLHMDQPGQALFP